jgi:hypothetical protein
LRRRRRGGPLLGRRLITTEFDVETERLIGLGARRIRDIERGGARWRTFGDIEDNEFDLIAG